MHVQVSGNTNVSNHDPDILTSNIFRGHSFVGHRAIPHYPSQGLTQRVRGGRDVIEQPDLSKISHLTEVKSKKLVVYRTRGKVKKPDLTWDTEPGINLLDFLSAQRCFLQERLQLDPSRLRPFVGKPGGRPDCSRDRAQTLGFEVVHGCLFALALAHADKL